LLDLQDKENEEGVMDQERDGGIQVTPSLTPEWYAGEF
jgi:hypothetical protein